MKFSSNFPLFLKSNLSIFCYLFLILKIVNFFHFMELSEVSFLLASNNLKWHHTSFFSSFTSSLPRTDEFDQISNIMNIMCFAIQIQDFLHHYIIGKGDFSALSWPPHLFIWIILERLHHWISKAFLQPEALFFAPNAGDN